jgi:hypothetical protein
VFVDTRSQRRASHRVVVTVSPSSASIPISRAFACACSPASRRTTIPRFARDPNRHLPSVMSGLPPPIVVATRSVRRGPDGSPQPCSRSVGRSASPVGSPLGRGRSPVRPRPRADRAEAAGPRRGANPHSVSHVDQFRAARPVGDRGGTLQGSPAPCPCGDSQLFRVGRARTGWLSRARGRAREQAKERGGPWARRHSGVAVCAGPLPH